MHFPKFWAKGESGSAVCWRWSDTSQEDAQAKADARAVELEKIIESGTRPDRYGYANRPLREERVEEQPGYAVTRNAYGALVLNTERAMFVDVDFHDDPSQEPGALDSLRGLATQHGLGTRIYRTAGGLRGLVTSATFDPKAPATMALLKEVGCDPLYIRLCQAQASFRARLTPKPWRLEMRPPSVRWPFEDEDVEARFAEWLRGYDQKSRGHAVCTLVEHAGPQTIDAAVAPVVALHDARCLGTGTLA
jgi:hypothetical protein